MPWTSDQWDAEEAQLFGNKLLSRFGLDPPAWSLSTWLGLYRGVLMMSGGLEQPPHEDIAERFARCVLEQIAYAVEKTHEGPQLVKAYSFGSLLSDPATLGQASVPLKESGQAVATNAAPSMHNELATTQSISQIAPTQSISQIDTVPLVPFLADPTYSHFGSCLGHKVLLGAQKGKMAWRGRLDEVSLGPSPQPGVDCKLPLAGVSAPAGYLPTAVVTDEAREMVSESDAPTLLYSPESSPTTLAEENKSDKHEFLEDFAEQSLRQEVLQLRGCLLKEREEHQAAWQSLANFLDHTSTYLPGDTGSDTMWRSDLDGGEPLNGAKLVQLRKKILSSFVASGNTSASVDGRGAEQLGVDNSILSSIDWDDCVTTLAFAKREKEKGTSACSDDSFKLNTSSAKNDHNVKLAAARATLAELGGDTSLSLPDSWLGETSFNLKAASQSEALGLRAAPLDVSSELALYQQACLELDSKQQQLISEVRLRDEELSQLRVVATAVHGIEPM